MIPLTGVARLPFLLASAVIATTASRHWGAWGEELRINLSRA
ncbi:hypothetical protein [Speluncibacter jeojiensis]|uniref:Uncharacterized protein n=1 Tax=Speluncibacter jeojiensis TaxID=2710754 RepID=A0A9X4M2Z1_9ACTN|nr:hypothetical protein [Rhodococcus sp. D2-41]MDG3017098.1 hypothetical protein [Corynebacteriales bacterium D3-21]